MAGSAIATAYVQLVPTTSGMASAISSEFTGVGEAAGQNMSGGIMSAVKKLAGPLAAAFTIGAAISFGKDAIQQASDLNESANAIKVTFGDASGAIATLGETASKRLGLSQSQFNGIATQFSAFAGTIAGEGGNVADVIDKISQRGSDFASVMNLDVSESMRIFQSGLAGETEPLRKYGIDLSQAAVEAYAMSAGIWDGVGTMTEAQKVQARYGALMAQTSKVQGDFANTSDGLANSQRIANAEIADAQAKLGSSFLPIVQAVTVFLADTFVPILNDLGTTFGNVFQWINENANLAIPIFAALGAVLVSALAPAIWAAVTATWAFTAALLANPITWIVLAIGVLIGAIVLLAMNWDTVVKWITDVWGGFIGWLQPGLKAIGDAFTSVFNGIGKVISGVFEGIVWVIKTYINTILKVINAVIDGLNGVGSFISKATGGTIGFKLGKLPLLAEGGTITGAGTVMVGEKGPELLNLGRGASVIPLDKASNAQTVNYYAAPNQSIDAEQALFQAIKRAKVVGAW